jgi:type I restriction enzyme, S subunit
MWPMHEIAIPKAGWTTVVFGDVVRQVKDKVDPVESGLERYIAGEHMDSDDLRIRRWGEIGDGYLGPAFHMRFKPGHVLYGSRRTYLRKVALADFGGITANTTYVLESKDSEILLPELLPFIMQAESFHAHSKRESKGSVNPYVNFSDLAWYKFLLPPLEEQRQISDVLWATTMSTNSLLELKHSLDQMIDSTLQDEFAIDFDGAPLSDWCQNLITYGIVQAGPDTPDGIPYIRVSDMTSGPELQLDGMLRTTKDIASKFRRSEVAAGDIVVALRGPVGLPMVVPQELDGANLTQGTARVSIKPVHVRDYVLWALRSPATHRQYMRYAKGSTFSEISLDALRKIHVPVRGYNGQRDVSNHLNKLAVSRNAIVNRVDASRSMARSFLEQLLKGEI